VKLSKIPIANRTVAVQTTILMIECNSCLEGFIAYNTTSNNNSSNTIEKITFKESLYVVL
jgi:hypothetical protein